MNPITRRALVPSILALSIPAIASATYTKPKKCECECKGEKGEPGDKGDTGPMGPASPKGDPGKCECKPKEPISIHIDAEYFLNTSGFPIPLPDIIAPTPSNGALMNELWYFKNPNACV